MQPICLFQPAQEMADTLPSSLHVHLPQFRFARRTSYTYDSCTAAVQTPRHCAVRTDASVLAAANVTCLTVVLHLTALWVCISPRRCKKGIYWVPHAGIPFYQCLQQLTDQ